MGIISYAQNFEDVMLWRALGHINNGFYIDVGAQHPVIDSVSKAFYDNGWRGVNVEPSPFYAELLRQARPRDVILGVAVGDREGILPFYQFQDTGLSTGDLAVAKSHVEKGFLYEKIEVPVITLDDVFSKIDVMDVHWLKIDVEGFEKKVLQGWRSDSSIRPWIIVVESTKPLTTIHSHRQWNALLIAKGYSYVYFDGLNRFYIDNNRIYLKKNFLAPPNVFDEFSISDTSSSTIHKYIVDKYRSL